MTANKTTKRTRRCRRLRYLTKEEAKLLLTELKKISVPAYRMAYLSLSCGLRQSEILKLKRRDFDFERKIIMIQMTMLGKVRSLFMTKKVKSLFEDIRTLNPDDYVFNGRYLGERRKDIPRAWKKVIEDLKFNQGITDPKRRVIFHSLRVTFATWLLLQDVDPLTIRELMGFSSIHATPRFGSLRPYAKSGMNALENLHEGFLR